MRKRYGPTKVLRIVPIVAAVAACGVTGPSIGELGDLRRAERVWEAKGPTSYAYSLERLCFCASEGRGPVRVRVEDGVVTERTYVDGGGAVPEPLWDAFPPVEGLFDVLRAAYAAGAHSVRVTYDPELGLPLELFIDYEEQMADEELGMRVAEDVEPLP